MIIIKLPNDLEINDMGLKEITIFIRRGAKIGSTRMIGTPDGMKYGTVKRHLLWDKDPVYRKAGGKMKRILPGKNYYRIELDE